MVREPSPLDVTFWNVDDPSIMYAFKPGAWFSSNSRPSIIAPLVLSSNPESPSPGVCANGPPVPIIVVFRIIAFTLSSFHLDRLYCSTIMPRYFEFEIVTFSNVGLVVNPSEMCRT